MHWATYPIIGRVRLARNPVTIAVHPFAIAWLAGIDRRRTRSSCRIAVAIIGRKRSTLRVSSGERVATAQVAWRRGIAAKRSDPSRGSEQRDLEGKEGLPAALARAVPIRGGTAMI